MNMNYVFALSMQILSKTFIILRIIERDVFENLNWYLCESPVNHVRF